jgi:arylamine N-acetyltransferase
MLSEVIRIFCLVSEFGQSNASALSSFRSPKMHSAFNSADLERYFDAIELPAEFRNYKQIPKDFAFLRVLHVHQIATIPYENLSIHYSKSHAVHIDPRLAFEKFIAGRGRGGYCMEVEIFFLHVLRAIGFQVYFTGVRIRQRNEGVPDGDFGGL